MQQRLADFRAMYEEQRGPKSQEDMICKIGGGEIGVFQGSTSQAFSAEALSEMDETARNVYMEDFAKTLKSA
jgi:hypothetical protein